MPFRAPFLNSVFFNSRLFLACIEESFLLREFDHAVDAAFTADTAFLVSAEWCSRISRAVIDVDVAGLDAVSDGDGFLFRAIDAGFQALADVVGNGNGIIDVLVSDDAEDWSEDFILRDCHAVLDVGEDDRMDVVAAGFAKILRNFAVE